MATKPALTWFHILAQPECTNCEIPRAGWSTEYQIKLAKHGLRRAYCPTCTANLPDSVALHLDRAIRNRWFLAWWRLAAQLLRRPALSRRKAAAA